MKSAHEKFFDRKTCKLFGDMSHRLMTARKTGQRFLVRYSSAWSDMFDGVKKYYYYLNPIGTAPEFRIYNLVSNERTSMPRKFRDIEDVKDFLAGVTHDYN